MTMEKNIIKKLKDEAEDSHGYVPTIQTKMFYCSIEEYEKVREEQPEKLQKNPVLHRYYQNNYCVNTDGIGKPFSLIGFSNRDPQPSECPDELLIDVDFPLQLELAGNCDTLTDWDFNTKIQEFKFEKLFLYQSLTGKTTKIYKIYVSLDNRLDNKSIRNRSFYIEIKELLLPPYPVFFTDKQWWNEEAGDNYTKKDLINELVAKVKAENPCEKEGIISFLKSKDLKMIKW